MSGGESLRELLGRGDPDELVREVDRRAVREDWEGVLRLHEHCGHAAERLGRQLWGVAQYAAYRVALSAPARLAGPLVEPGAARFALGPLTEVVAQHHTWDELADHLPHRVSAAMVAQERVLRGEDLRGDARAHSEEVGLPLVLQPWEDDYPLPEYREDEVLEGGPAAVATDRTVEAPPGSPRPMTGLRSALEDLAAPWAVESTGEVRTATVRGRAPAAVGRLAEGPVGIRELTAGQALARMAWAAASGGRRGRRRGLAAGRSAAWWVAHQVTGLAFPAEPDELGAELGQRRWYLFEPASAPSGWVLRLAVEDPAGGWAAAIDAHDVDAGG